MSLITRLAAATTIIGGAAFSIPMTNAGWEPWERDRNYGPGYGYGPYRHYKRGWEVGSGDTFDDIRDDMLGDMDIDSK